MKRHGRADPVRDLVDPILKLEGQHQLLHLGLDGLAPGLRFGRPRIELGEGAVHIGHQLADGGLRRLDQAGVVGCQLIGLNEASTRRPDLVTVDLGLPDGDGVDFIREVRTWSGVPIIVLSARTHESQKVAALDAGADDFITKPFGVGELLARTRASLRRMRAGRAATDSVFCFGQIEVDLAARIVKRRDAEVHLTPIEYRLLGVLIANAGRVLTHPYLLREVWGPGHAESTHYLRVYLGNLRQKLEDDSAQPRHILTETGVGYRLLVD